MSRFAICNPDGSINHIFSGPQSISQKQCNSNQVAKQIPDNLDDVSAYWDSANNVIKAKASFSLSLDKTQITADGKDTATVSGIPSGTKVTWPDGQVDTISDGTAGFAVDQVGKYVLTFQAILYLTKEITIEAVAPA